MSAIANWRRRVHKRSSSESKLDSSWTFPGSPLGFRSRESTRRDVGDKGKEPDAAIAFHSYVDSPRRSLTMFDSLENVHPMDAQPPPPPPKSRKIIENLDAMIEEEERLDKLRRAALPSETPGSSSELQNRTFTYLRVYDMPPIKESEADTNVLVGLPPPPRHAKAIPRPTMVLALKHQEKIKARPRQRHTSSLPTSPTFKESSSKGASRHEANVTHGIDILGDISRVETNIVSGGQWADEGLTDVIKLRPDENRTSGGAGGLEWPLAWQWSPAENFNTESASKQKTGQVDSGRDSSSSRNFANASRDQAPQTTPATDCASSSSPSLPALPIRIVEDRESVPKSRLSEVTGTLRNYLDQRGRLYGSEMWNDEQDGRGRRALGSHGAQASIYSVDSSIMPASTVEHEPRISISSTIYHTSSDVHSHSHSLYNTPMPPVSVTPDRASFIDLYSPTRHEFDYDNASPADPVSPIYFAESPHSPDLTLGFKPSSKPPLPTAPKPYFKYSNSRQPSPMPETSAPSGSGGNGNGNGGERKKKNRVQDESLPPTTNFLDTDERADLIRKSRKLARVFGETPGADAFPLAQSQEAWRATGKHLHLSSSTSRRHSMPLSPDDFSFLSIVSPTFSASGSSGKKKAEGKNSGARDKQCKDSGQKKGWPSSPTSFIDLSDEERTSSQGATKSQRALPSFASAPTSPLSPRPTIVSDSTDMDGRPPSPTQSFVSTYTVDTIMPDPEEEDRRRKRERLAKLHRFLGSRVPANLVLGIDERADEASLPPPFQALSALPLSIPAAITSDSAVEVSSPSRGVKPAWMKRRRSSSAGLLPSFGTSSDAAIHPHLDRQREELDNAEKAINVRRAHKMEKVFGVAPPQTLYHTRQAVLSSPAIISPPATSKNAKKASAAASTPLIPLPPIPSFQPFSDVLLIQRNPNTHRASYTSRKSGKSGKSKRPGTPESIIAGRQTLLPAASEVGHGSHFDDREFGKHGVFGDDPLGSPEASTYPAPLHSFIYNHYQHSLNSLNDILDRDDRESLAELHDYLNSTNPNSADIDNAIPAATDEAQFIVSPPPPDSQERIEQEIRVRDRSASTASSLKSERRRSLPARTSIISLAPSEFSIATMSSMSPPLDVQANEFQQRRRRAAKLAQFFGVNYRELVNDVLESIESGVTQEQMRGTLKAEEVEDLLTRLRTLKVKRARMF